MRVLLLDPFHTGSHRAWSTGWKKWVDAHPEGSSIHQIDLWTLPGRNWKWRMHGAAALFAQRASGHAPDWIVATDLMDVAQFRGLLPADWRHVPVAIYFHENQLTYPWSEEDPDAQSERKTAYGYLNWSSALAADLILFNSAHHRDLFFAALPQLFEPLPKPHPELQWETLKKKSVVLPIGMDWEGLEEPRLENTSQREAPPLILWNHRWEWDKAPDRFFEVIEAFDREGWDFQCAVLGPRFRRMPQVFEAAYRRWPHRWARWGGAEDRAIYASWLSRADLLIHAPRQENFGISMVEAMYCGTVPWLAPGTAGTEIAQGFPTWENPQACCAHFEHWVGSSPASRQAQKVRAHALAVPFGWQFVAPLYAEALERARP